MEATHLTRRCDDDSNLEHEFGRALENNEFELHYQPQVRLHDGRTIGIEALLRWRHPSRGMLAPQDFLKLLEENPISAEVGAEVIDIAFRDISKALQASKMPPVRIAVNLFPSQFSLANLAETILSSASLYGLPPAMIEIEITERVALDCYRAGTNCALRKLRDAGCYISLDDFGTGYGSMDTVIRFPINKLKIDRRFVARLGSCQKSEAVVKTILSLAKQLDMSVTAEGIETEAQLRLLIEYGCHAGQGYFYAKPMPFEKLQMWLLQENCSRIDREAS